MERNLFETVSTILADDPTLEQIEALSAVGEGGEYRCPNCWILGWDCLYEVNLSGNRCCPICIHGSHDRSPEELAALAEAKRAILARQEATR